MPTAFKNAAIELAAELDGVNWTDVENRWYCNEENAHAKRQKQVAEVKEMIAAGADDDEIVEAVRRSLTPPFKAGHCVWTWSVSVISTQGRCFHPR